MQNRKIASQCVVDRVYIKDKLRGEDIGVFGVRTRDRDKAFFIAFNLERSLDILRRDWLPKKREIGIFALYRAF